MAKLYMAGLAALSSCALAGPAAAQEDYNDMMNALVYEAFGDEQAGDPIDRESWHDLECIAVAAMALVDPEIEEDIDTFSGIFGTLSYRVGRLSVRSPDMDIPARVIDAGDAVLESEESFYAADARCAETRVQYNDIIYGIDFNRSE